MATSKKYVYFFGSGKAEGKGSEKTLLGGKGAGLAEMTHIGLPVPAGFTITVDACAYYDAHDRQWPPGMEKEVRQQLGRLEKTCGKKLGDARDPLLVSVRSGAARSMPGMMETILNLGLNDAVGRRARRGDGQPALRVGRLSPLPANVLDGRGRAEQGRARGEAAPPEGTRGRASSTTSCPPSGSRSCAASSRRSSASRPGKDFPQDPWEQLGGAINAVFRSWNADKAVTYRRVEKITDLKGTAVNVQQMVFGNMGDDSGTGVCFTRDPSTGENEFYGDMLVNAQGEDVVAGIRTPIKLNELGDKMPAIYDQLCAVRAMLEIHYGEMQDLEFTFERGKLYMLQCRTGKRTPAAAFRIAVEQATQPLMTAAEAKRLAKAGYLPQKYLAAASKPVITKEQAILRIVREDIERLFYPVISPKVSRDELARHKLTEGINAVPGAACGKVVFTAREAERLAEQGEEVILVRKETSPEDVGGMQAAKGILTQTGGKTSHAAVVARGWGKCCIVGLRCAEHRLRRQADVRQRHRRRGRASISRSTGRSGRSTRASSNCSDRSRRPSSLR